MGTKLPSSHCFAVYCSSSVVFSAGGWLCLVCFCAWSGNGVLGRWTVFNGSLVKEGCAIP